MKQTTYSRRGFMITLASGLAGLSTCSRKSIKAPYKTANETNEKKRYTKELIASDFEKKVLECPRPVVVDFYADWCGGCIHIAPEVEELAKQYDNIINIYKFDTDQKGFDLIYKAFKVESIPDVRLFYNGKSIVELERPLAKNLEHYLDRIGWK